MTRTLTDDRRYLDLGAGPAFLLGVNYWSQAGGPRMWDRFDAAQVEREVRTMRGFGANACRAFIFVPSFMPAPPRVDATALGHFRTFLDLAARHDLRVFPSLLVGHMSGENYDFPGQRGRSLYQDPELLGWQVALAEAVAGAARGHPAVAGWVLSNEMPLWGGKAGVETIRTWAETLFSAIRRADPGRPVGIGDGFMNQKGGQNGFDARMVAQVADWLGPHTYYADVDPLRHAVQTEVLVRSLQGHGRPVVLEEFGCSSAQASAENQAVYFRESVHGVLSIGGGGALGWCYGDFRLGHESPYRHHGFELGFGLVDADGQDKPAAAEVRAVSQLLQRFDVARLRFERPRAAIVVPSYFETDYPFSWEDRRRMRLVVIQSYALALAAGIEVDVVPEDAALDPYDLLLIPSTQKLLEPTWENVATRVRAGATAYASFFYSDNAFHTGMWWSGFEQATGLRHALRYGQPDVPGPRVTLALPGGRIATPVARDLPFPAARLPVRVQDARVVAKDGDGRPALTFKQHGRGRFYFLTYPWEYYLSRRAPSLERDRSHLLYATLRDAAGLPRPWIEGPPTVHGRRVGVEGGGALAWVFNRAFAPTDVRLRLPAGSKRLGVPKGRAATRGGVRIRLAAKDVQVWELPPAPG